MTKQQYQLWFTAQKRLDSIDWELPVSIAEIDSFHNTLPVRLNDETIQAWLRRVLTDNKALPPYYAVSYITRRAASDGTLSKQIVLESDDSKFRITLNKTPSLIHLKIEALGLAIEDYAHRHLEITSKSLSENFRIQLALNALAEAETTIGDNENSRQLLFNPDTRIIIRVL